MMNIGDRVRDLKYGGTGKVVRILAIPARGRLAVIRLENEDPILGSLTTAFEEELEVVVPKAEGGVTE